MHPASLLRLTYRVNAVATLACGVLLLALGHVLAPLFALPVAPLWGVGAGFVAFAAWLLAASRRARPAAGEALAIGALDAVYALASFVAVAELGSRMTPELRAAVALVALPVALFAAVELASGRRLLRAARPAVA